MIVLEKEIITEGKLIRIAKLKNEWFEDIGDADKFINDIRDIRPKPDIFTFWQRLPESEPKYDYYMEPDNAAAIHLTTFDNWWKNQINAKTRNVARKAEKKNVEIYSTEFDDALVRGIKSIFDESKVRQGKPFWHYKKPFDQVKLEMSDRLEISEFIGAYYKDELIGFIKLLFTDRYAMTVEILSKLKHRDKSPTNALLANAIKICTDKNIPYIVYSKWSSGSLGDFKKHNGFKQVNLPRYFVPLTIKGKVALKYNLHRGLSELIPTHIKNHLKKLRNTYYLRQTSN